MSRRWRLGLALLVLLTGLGMITAGGWIQLKARLAQTLLAHAWHRTQQGDPDARPWPWADTRPLARLRVPRLDIEQIVLAGASGRTLAFAPGHMAASAAPGELGTTVLSGHRDTHFGFLQHLESGDRVLLDTPGGEQSYQVIDRQVVDTRTTPLRLQHDRSELVLITCYPFNVVAPTGPLRYRVTAVPVSDGG